MESWAVLEILSCAGFAPPPWAPVSWPADRPRRRRGLTTAVLARPGTARVRGLAAGHSDPLVARAWRDRLRAPGSQGRQGGPPARKTPDRVPLRYLRGARNARAFILTESPRALAGGMLVAVARNGVRCSAVGAGGYLAVPS